MASSPSLRVNVLDADQLDVELHQMLCAQLQSLFKYFVGAVGGGSGGIDSAEWNARVSAVVSAMIVGGSIVRDQPTPAQALQNVKYVGANGAPLTRAQKCLYLIATAALPYAAFRLERVMNATGDASATERARRVYRFAQSAAAALTLLNFLRFLYDAGFAHILFRILGIRTAAVNVDAERLLSYDYMHHFMALSAMSALTTAALPIVSPAVQWANTALSYALTRDAKADSMSADVSASAAASCTLCGSAETCQPFVCSPCRHVYCYYCIAARMERSRRTEERTYRCGKCQAPVESIAPYRMDDDADNADDVLERRGREAHNPLTSDVLPRAQDEERVSRLMDAYSVPHSAEFDLIDETRVILG